MLAVMADLLRSVLYMPAANERALEKAKSIPCDAIIFDLEDAVALEAKKRGAGPAPSPPCRRGTTARQLTIRCNGLATEWGSDDLAAAADARPAPSSSPRSTRSRRSTRSPPPRRGGATETSIWAMIETPTAIFDVRALAAHPRVRRARDRHQRPGRELPRRSASPGGRNLDRLSGDRRARRPRARRRRSSTACSTTSATPTGSPPSAARAWRWASTARR